MPAYAAAERRLGAYGLTLRGLSSPLLVRAESDWRPLEIVRRIGHCGFEHDHVSATTAELVLASNGGLVVEREGRATFITAQPIDDSALIHPHLGTAAAIIAHWDGREVFHAGAVVIDGGAWAVLGEREAGKSTLLASMALKGYAVLSDDIVVVDGGSAFAGPRSIDLRESSAAALATGIEMGVVGARERWRVELGDVDPVVPLRGWVFLSWGEDVAVANLAASDVLPRLTAQRAVRLLPPDPTHLLRLSALPGLELRRPHDWAQLPPATDVLLREIAQAHTTPPGAS